MTEPQLLFDLPLPASHPLAKPPAAKSGKRPEPPVPFPEKIADRIAQIVKQVFDAGDPALNEEWCIDQVRASCEAARAARGQREAKEAKRAKEPEPTPTAGQPPQASPAVLKEKHSKVKHRHPFINNVPLSPEEHAARNEADQARRGAMTPEEREASRGAWRKEAGILTPEEQKERRTATQEREKAKIAKMSPNFRAQYLAGKAKAKQMMAEERARLAAKNVVPNE